MSESKKITRATLKAFLKKNKGALFFKSKSSFDGMVDCVMETGGEWGKLAGEYDESQKYTLGFKGVWLVGGSRDYIKEYTEAEYIGYEVYNCCGHFLLAIIKK